MTDRKPPVTVNDRTYAWPKNPVVVVCIDGSEPAYIEQAVKARRMPFTAGILKSGADLRAKCIIPAFTNPNNLSIVTGAPPSVHGICGNFFYNTETGSEVMMNDPKLLRAGTIFKAFFDAGAKITIITAKDKLRKLLGHGLDYSSGRAMCFSSEKADETTRAEHGIDNAQAFVGRPIPSVYSAELSEFIFDAGVKLMARDRPDLMYLSTTDYIQHKHAPGSPVANDFYAMMDGYWAQLDAMGATLALTADHGMADMHNAAGAPDVVYLQPILDAMLGVGAARVILPITDPYVVHHGALGGYATAYLPDGADIAKVCADLAAIDGIEVALTNGEACRRFLLPPDRVGDIVIIATANKAVGSQPDKHDLSGLTDPLRSHGGLSTQNVPLIVNRPVSGLPASQQLRNFDIFSVALNNVA
ncbi:MAG: phosphonoacetate hydrolase [Rhodospirillales bacterium]|nr:phosphonoacetate hydrolase [Rhodospirillales bacterium]